MDSTRNYHSEHAAPRPAMPTQAELEAMFDVDEAGVAAGRVVSPEPALARMRGIAARTRRERHLKETTTPSALDSAFARGRTSVQ